MFKNAIKFQFYWQVVKLMSTAALKIQKSNQFESRTKQQLLINLLLKTFHVKTCKSLPFQSGLDLLVSPSKLQHFHHSMLCTKPYNFKTILQKVVEYNLKTEKYKNLFSIRHYNVLAN